MTALFLSHAEPTTEPDPVVGSRRAAMEFLLGMGGTFGYEEARHGRNPYRTFEWRRECVLAGTPAWLLVLGWQDFDADVPAGDQPAPDETPWFFMVEVWDTDVSVPDYDTRGTMVQQFQTRAMDLVAHTVQTILDHADESVGS